MRIIRKKINYGKVNTVSDVILVKYLIFYPAILTLATVYFYKQLPMS